MGHRPEPRTHYEDLLVYGDSPHLGQSTPASSSTSNGPIREGILWPLTIRDSAPSMEFVPEKLGRQSSRVLWNQVPSTIASEQVRESYLSHCLTSTLSSSESESNGEINPNDETNPILIPNDDSVLSRPVSHDSMMMMIMMDPGPEEGACMMGPTKMRRRSTKMGRSKARRCGMWKHVRSIMEQEGEESLDYLYNEKGMSLKSSSLGGTMPKVDILHQSSFLTLDSTYGFWLNLDDPMEESITRETTRASTEAQPAWLVLWEAGKHMSTRLKNGAIRRKCVTITSEFE